MFHMTRKEKIEKLIAVAGSLVGTPYEYGAYLKLETGNSKHRAQKPKTLDCSSFTKYIFAQIGVDLPRSSILQAAAKGRTIKNARGIKPGDIIFFEGTKGHYSHKLFHGKRIYIGHVAIYIGNGEIIHARESVGQVGTQKLSALTNKKFYNITLIRRII
jgi:cell wall-associated NlpC family hydrolase